MRSNRPPSRSTHSNFRRGGPPTWLIFLLGIALVFGLYYLWQGVQGFIRSGGLTIGGATEQAIVVATETAVRIETQDAPAIAFTPLPTQTPLPECQDFVVSVPSAVIREGPTTRSLALDSRSEGEVVCVLERATENTDWYLIDQNPATRRIEAAYMFEDIIEALNPTLTPSLTFTPAPTVTPVPTNTPTLSPTPAPTQTPNPNASNTPTLTPPPTPTTPLQSI